MAKVVPLTKGFFATVDDEDFEKVSAFKWTAHTSNERTVYATRVGPRPHRDRVWLHHFVMGVRAMLDHVDHNGLNCQKSNLRFANHSQNNGNARKRVKKFTSQFKGVGWNRSTAKWQVKIAGKYVGVFSSEEEAARVWDEHARQYYGTFACTNF